MKFNIKIILFAIALLSVGACSKTKVEPEEKKPAAAADVYIAGSYRAANNIYVAAYWKNGALVKLTDSTVNSSASSITVNGNDVYVTGAMRNSSTGISDVVYWKNGVMTKLTGVAGVTDGSNIVVNGTDVYVVGKISIPTQKPNLSVPAYWKNGVPQTLKLTSNDISLDANSLAIIGNDVYVSGQVQRPGNGSVAAYWKNGELTTLSTTTVGSGSYSRGIAVQGTDVYISGYSFDDGAGYWKNGTFNKLSTNYLSIYAIAVKGSDVYVAGAKDAPLNSSGFLEGYMATYWKNGVANQIGTLVPVNAGYYPAAKAIALNGDDVYVIGDFNSKPSYWKNNALIQYSTNGIGSGIFVVSK